MTEAQKIEKRPDPVAAIPALHGLRFVAALFVLFGQTYRVAPFGGSSFAGEVMLSLPPIGLTLFFMLSGFVLWFNYSPLFRSIDTKQALWHFTAARLARIFPLYLLVLLAGIMVAGFGTLVETLPGSLLFLPLAQSWIAGSGHNLLLANFGTLDHTWATSTALFLSLAFPFFLVCTPRIRTLWSLKWLIAISVILFAAIQFLIARYSLAISTVLVPGQISSAGLKWLTFYSPCLRILEFGIGCMLARAHMAARKRPGGIVTPPNLWMAWCLVIVLAVTVVIANAVEFPDEWSFAVVSLREGAIVLLAVILLSSIAIYPLSRVSALLASRYFVLGGALSFSLCLLHPFVLSLLRQSQLFETALTSWETWLPVFLLAIAIQVLVALAGARLIEVPAQRLVKRSLLRLNPAEGMPFVGLWLAMIIVLILLAG